MAVEDIPAGDSVSRLVEDPVHWSRAENAFLERMLFQFPSQKDADGNVVEEESLVWRKYVVDQAELHGMGCQKQHKRLSEGKSDRTYAGAATATVAAVRNLEKNGHAFVIEHAPEEGAIWHVAVKIQRGAGWIKAHKLELRDLIQALFEANFDPHRCEDVAGHA